MGEKVNSNYTHACDSNRVIVADYAAPISSAGYSLNELGRVLDFYISRAPILKSGAKAIGGTRSLGAIGWKGSRGERSLPTLERKLLQAAGMQGFYLIKGRQIKETLVEMNLDEKACIDHPRCVMQWDVALSISEAGVLTANTRETRMECLFRHIRNSLAHSRTYVFSNDAIMLEDCDLTNGSITARLLLNKATLLDWISIIDPKS